MSAPDEHKMQESYSEQHGHAPIEQSECSVAFLLGMTYYYREAHTEEQREQCVKLAVDEHILQETHYPVHTG